MKNNIPAIVAVLFAAFILYSCKGKSTSGEGGGERKSVTPITVTHPVVGVMQEEIELNAVSAFLQKNMVKATTNSYLKSVDVLPGQKVAKGQVLFVLKGKEAENLGSVINDLDTTAHFTGEVKIIANHNGFINNITHQTGDYVQEGDILAEVSDAGSLVFLMQLPYELNTYLSKNHGLDLELPDGRILKGTLSSAMPTVDPVSQTQSIVIRINSRGGDIPENLIVKVRFVKSVKNGTVSLPKAAVLSDETQEHLWIMKMTDKETAVKVPIKTGLESLGMIEILSPMLSPDDLILETGNYGLPDTAKVVVQK